MGVLVLSSDRLRQEREREKKKESGRFFYLTLSRGPMENRKIGKKRFGWKTDNDFLWNSNFCNFTLFSYMKPIHKMRAQQHCEWIHYRQDGWNCSENNSLFVWFLFLFLRIPLVCMCPNLKEKTKTQMMKGKTNGYQCENFLRNSN